MKLLVKTGGEVREMTFTQDVVTIGRLTDSSVVVQDKKASRQHAKIEKVGAEYRLSDLESNNGTKVNDQKVMIHTLRLGDEVAIGDVTITVVEIDSPPPAVPAPAPEPSPQVKTEHGIEEKAPVPIEKKMELKKKIEDVKAGIEEVKSAHVKNKILAKIAAVAAVLLVAVVAIVVAGSMGKRELPGADKTRAKEQAEKQQALKDEAERELAFARQQVANGEIDLDRLQSLSEKYDKLLKEDTFAKLIETAKSKAPVIVKKQPIKADPADAKKTEEAIELALAARNYSEAIALVTSTGDEKRISDVRDAIYNDFMSVLVEGYAAENREDYRTAKSIYTSAAPRFKGTEYEGILTSRPGDLDLLARAKAETKTETAKTEPKKETPKVEPKKEEAPVTAKVDTSGLQTKLIAAINAGAFTSAVKFSDATQGIPSKADDNGISLKDGGDVAWGDIEAKVMFRLYGQVLQGDDLLGLAEWAHDKDLQTDANKTLNVYLVRNKDGKAKVDEMVARWKGVRVPDGGYAYNGKLGAWEDKSDVAERTAREAIAKLGKDLASASDVKKMDEVMGKILEHYNNTNLKDETRQFVKQTAIDALRANKEKKLESIAAKAKSAAGFEKLRMAKLELNKRREEALKVIYDVKIYLPENHPDWRKGDKINGQEEVDRLVGRVRELWEAAGQYIASLDPSISRDIASVQEINAKYLAELGEQPSEDDLKGFEEIMANLNTRIDLKSFALNSKERSDWEWNRWVDQYNEKLSEPGVGSEEKAHFKVVNDYREMMGRRRMFLDARLCRATKKHSGACDAAGRIWHEGSDGSPQSRAKAEGFPGGVGENVAIGYGSPSDVWWKGWYRASDHHRNGLSEAWNCGGYGYQGSVGTENFSNIGAPKGK